jgi:putative PEP-CTERM system TPR-repeat lipoprotein
MSRPSESVPWHRLPAALALAGALAACGAEGPDRTLALAKADLAKNERSAAVLRLRGALQENPDAAELRFLLGRVLLELGDPVDAEKELRRAWEQGFDPEQAKPLVARALIERGEHRQVLRDFSAQQFRGAEARADVLVSHAYAHLAEGNLEAARLAVRQAIEAKPDHRRALIVQSLVRQSDGELEQATAGIDAVLAEGAASVEALRAKASIAEARGDRPVAIDALRRIARLTPRDIGAHHQAIVLLLREGRTDEARAQVQAMRRAAAQHPLTAHAQAMVAVRERNLVAARDHLAEALKLDPAFAPSLLLAGSVNAQLGAFEVAEKHLQTLLAKNPGNLAGQQAMIGILLSTGRTDQAKAMAQRLLGAAPDHPNALMAAAAVHLQTGDPRKAEPLFQKATASDPKQHRAYTGLALARLESGEHERVIQDLMSASAADESEVEADSLLLRYYVAKGQFDKALEVVATIARKQPGEGRLLNLEGEVLAAAGRTEEARAAFEKAFETRPDFMPPLRNLARLDLAENKPERARKRFEEAIARWPEEPRILVTYAQFLTVTKADPDTVRRTLEHAVAVSPGDAETRIALTKFHADRRDLDRALTATEAAVAAIPGDVRLLALLAEVQSRAKKPELAAVTLAKAIALAPDSASLLVGLSDAQLAHGAEGAALDSARKAVTLQPADGQAVTRVVTLEQRAGRPAEALKAARELQKLRPDDATGYLLEGRIHRAARNSSEAARVYRLGLQNAGAPQIAIALHQLLRSAGRPAEAEKLAAEWVKAHPRDKAMRAYLAETALTSGDYRNAFRAYAALAEDYPSDARIANNLAWAAYRMGEPTSVHHAQRAYRLAPDDPNVMDTLGWLLVEFGEVRRGTELLRQAVAAAPEEPGLRLHLAKALLKLGDKHGARWELDEIAKLGDRYPRQEEVRRLRAGL